MDSTALVLLGVVNGHYVVCKELLPLPFPFC